MPGLRPRHYAGRGGSPRVVGIHEILVQPDEASRRLIDLGRTKTKQGDRLRSPVQAV
jgi:hypothetical protein